MTMASLKRWIAAGAAVAATLLVAGCGGGSGAGAWGEAPGGTGGEASSLTLTTNVPTVGSDGKTVATLTAFVKDGGNRAMPNQMVTFSTADSGVVLLQSANVTDAAGLVTAKMTVVDPTNRDVTVNARSGSISNTLTVAVVGTTLSLDGPASLLANTPTEFSVALRDAAGAVIGGKQVKIASSAGNTLSAGTVTTDSAGRAKFLVTGVVPGVDTITATALGTMGKVTTEVAGTQLLFTTPGVGQELEVGLSHTVSVTLLSQGVPQSGQTVEFLATRGTITPSAQTDASGRATVTITASSAGLSTVTAKVGAVLSSQRVEFVSATPSKISVQASPANVGVNLGGASSNSSQLIAVVRDASDNPVKGQSVSFSADADPSNGRIEPAIATTDSAGVATVTFFPGANSTGNNQIILRATVVGKGVAGTTTLTASKQELMVRIGTGNKIEAGDPVSYTMLWDAVVTDSSGNPVANATVQGALVGTAFYKGRYYADGTEPNSGLLPGGETQGTPKYKCPGEDTNGNLRLDSGEDVNGDGQITPGNVAAVQVSANGGRTDSTGFARIEVKYPKQYANWAQVRLTVTITAIAGTEGTAVSIFDLPVAATDVDGSAAPPGGYVSAYGLTADCTTTN